MSNGDQYKQLSQRGTFTSKPVEYGRSVLGAPLFYFPAQSHSPETGLIIAGTHGDETASIALLSSALRSIEYSKLSHHLILSVNPDGNQLGVRSNANGVDLNRNFPANNWDPSGTVYRWNSNCPERNVRLSSGHCKASEPETQALIKLIEHLSPKFVISFHEPLACIDSIDKLGLGERLSDLFQLPLVANVGYETPGSFGTWCEQICLPNVTLELPAISVDDVTQQYLDAAIQLLTQSRF
ncbi:murein tripeptide amidase MpaA [Vibrio nitrifigilis]|uniref:Murein tripeptide amidase MpaA n=1 Tax=Vibrio nitrifigilis TaxID=2789781 RepID=A0ABS0GJ43_9VIBR|nr:murein tripeptide amidase MpaA [Vibrio nitrifigilis]MBF9002213.1 murein tripeptide amidase MpaA [Vibrio nitrifigilis]